MTVSDASAATSLTNRYGTPKRALTRRKKTVLSVVIAVVVLAFVTWLAVGRGPVAVDSKVVGFSVTDATVTEVDFQVIKDPGITAQCAVKALGSDFAIVGWDVLTIGPNGTGTGANQGRTTAHRATVRTESLAVSGVVDSCWTVRG